jgi:hypothetical protein
MYSDILKHTKTCLTCQRRKTSMDKLPPLHPLPTPEQPNIRIHADLFERYLASFVDDTALDCENFLPALMLSYNTSYHSTIATTPFELLFGTKPRLPSFPNPDIQRLHYGESSSAERYQLLQKISFIAKNISQQKQESYKDNIGKKALPHSFNIDNPVWYENFSPLGKNPKLTPKWSGPAKITQLNDTNAKILLPNGKSKVLNAMRLKKFFADKCSTSSDNTQTIPNDLDFNSEQNISRPMTRALKKLIDHKNAAQLVINVLCDL